MEKINNFSNFLNEIHSDKDMKRGEEDKKTKFGIEIKGKGDFRKDALIKKKLVRLKSQITDDKLKKQVDTILDLIEKN